jgi:2-polyprenyl-6-methoxyphenol hydroxylase-like FAD-dependent oxidoreductase
VSFEADGSRHQLAAGQVVGADGRASTVRRQCGITLERQAPINYIAGLLLDGLNDISDEHDVNAGEGDLLFLLFHQGHGRARAYLCSGLSGQHRFFGPEGTQRFLAACNMSCYPWGPSVAKAIPAGPCATYPGDDTWTDTPFTDGVVLIGDAAGHNDPIIGQGCQSLFATPAPCATSFSQPDTTPRTSVATRRNGHREWSDCGSAPTSCR